MKMYVEILLIMILVLLMYTKSQSLSAFAKSGLGKITLTVALLGITSHYGRNAGVIGAVIFVLLLHTSYENMHSGPSGHGGLSPGEVDAKKKKKEKKPPPKKGWDDTDRSNRVRAEHVKIASTKE